MTMADTAHHARVVTVIAGAVLLRLGFGFKVNHLGTAADGTFPIDFAGALALVAMLTIYTTALACLGLAVSGIEPARYGRPLGLAAVYAIFLGFVARYYVTTGGNLGADAILYSQYAADLLLQGQNPYAESMLPAYDRYPVDQNAVTRRVDGGVVETFSYPALAFLMYVPQRALGIPNANLTTLTVLLATLTFLVVSVPRAWGLAPVAVLFATPNLLNFSAGGVFDILWVLPLLLGMRAWAREQWRGAALWVGLAFAVKQTPWLIGPFLAIWLYLDSPSRAAAVERARTCLTWGLAAFLAPNLPFILWNPRAWLLSLDRATGFASIPMVPDGVGFVTLRTAGGLPIPRLAFVAVLGLVYLSLLAVYVEHFDRVKWLAWSTPALALFVHYRALQNYFIFFVPVAFYAVVLQIQHRPPEPSTAAGESDVVIEEVSS